MALPQLTRARLLHPSRSNTALQDRPQHAQHVQQAINHLKLSAAQRRLSPLNLQHTNNPAHVYLLPPSRPFLASGLHPLRCPTYLESSPAIHMHVPPHHLNCALYLVPYILSLSLEQLSCTCKQAERLTPHSGLRLTACAT